MPIEHTGGGSLGLRPIGDITAFVLVGLRLAARKPDGSITLAAKLADELGADPGRGARDDGYPQTLSCRAETAVRPELSTTLAVRWCCPLARPTVDHGTEYTPPGPVLSVPIRWVPSKNCTFTTFVVEPATTRRRSCLTVQAFASGSI
jgi:hypothetical protein